MGAPKPKKSGIAVAVGRRIAEIRRENGLRQSDVALRAGKAVKWWSRVEQGEENLMLTTLEEIAAALGVPPNELLVPATEPVVSRPGRPKRR